MKPIKKLIGVKFTRLIVIEYAGRDTKYNLHQWKCKCDCGTIKIIAERSLLCKNSVQSCGCLLTEKNIVKNTKHGLYYKKAYASYISMIDRCYNEKSKYYKNYGGRGIKVCPRWKNSIQKFYEDMGERPKGMQLDRIDNERGYFPKNCRWVTPKENCDNRRSSKYLTLDGITMTESDWARYTGIPQTTLNNRLNILGWSLRKALTR